MYSLVLFLLVFYKKQALKNSVINFSCCKISINILDIVACNMVIYSAGVGYAFIKSY